jgi:hypothetical protein
MFIQPEYVRRCYARRAIVVLRIRQHTVRTSEGELVTVSRTVSGFGAMSAAMVEGSLSMIHFRDPENDKIKTEISQLYCPFGHLQGALLGLITPDKARRVHKNTALNARDPRKFLVSDPAPLLR